MMTASQVQEVAEPILFAMMLVDAVFAVFG